MKSIVLPAGTEHVQFDELAYRIADALHPLGDSPTEVEQMTNGGAQINLEAELRQAVQSRVLPVKDPLTLGPHTYPVGNALQTALVTVSDLRLFLAGRLDVVTTEPTAAPEQSPATTAPVKNEPLPVTTSIMKMAFGHLVGDNTFSDAPKWLWPARVYKGTAPTPSTWNPIIAAKLIIDRDANEDAVHNAMVGTQELRMWRPLWQEFWRERNTFGS